MYALSYTTRHKTGTEDQFWAPDVYLTDHWVIFSAKTEAEEMLEIQNTCNDLHCWCIAEIISASEPHWTKNNAKITAKKG